MNDTIYLNISKKNDIKIDNSISFPDSIKREESKKAYTILKEMLKKLNIDFDIKNIEYSSNGKPYIKNSNVKFNYSHSKNYIACVVSNINLGIDIEDEFNISNKAQQLYLNGIKKEYRKAWVIKEAYCKLLDTFDDDVFKKIDITKINKNNYKKFTELYDCVLFYDGDIKKIEIID